MKRKSINIKKEKGIENLLCARTEYDRFCRRSSHSLFKKEYKNKKKAMSKGIEKCR
tara:strand:+ start:337 stop:504 length:168 start_codon:yes stop_codon:yes gene_type:complete